MNDAAPTDTNRPPPLLRLEFTYEFDDYAEAQESWAAGAAGSAPTPWRKRASLFGWVLFIGLAVMLFMLMQRRPNMPAPAPPAMPAMPGRPPAPVPAPLLNIVLPLIPWLLIFGFIWFFVFRQLRKSSVIAGAKPESFLFQPGREPPPRRRPRDPEARSPVPWAPLGVPLVVGAFVMLGYYGRDGNGSTAGGGPDFVALMLPVVPWLLIFLFIYFFVFRRFGGAGAIKSMWDTSPALHRPHVVDVEADHIVFTDAVNRNEHKWEAFTHVRETPGLFLLFTSNVSMHFLPKRVFPGKAEVDAFRELVRRTVAERPAPAFPVLPVEQRTTL